MLQWVQEHHEWVLVLTAMSVVVFLAGLVATPAIVARIPVDYFAHQTRPASVFASRHVVLRLFIQIARNVLGLVLLASGLAMLILPGPGLLALFAGFVLIDIPGKYRLEKWLVARSWAYSAINWLRRRSGREPLILKDHPFSPR